MAHGVSVFGLKTETHTMWTWILQEEEAFICKAVKGEVVVCYFEPLITLQMEASGSPPGVKNNEKKWLSSDLNYKKASH